MQKFFLPLFLIFTSGLSADPLIIQPGLPGTASKEIKSNEAINIEPGHPRALLAPVQ